MVYMLYIIFDKMKYIGKDSTLNKLSFLYAEGHTSTLIKTPTQTKYAWS